MGQGTGAPEGDVCPVTPGRILYELEGVEEEVAREAIRLASHKMPIATRFICRREEL
jgi:large subunit ribosomal protein L16